MKVLVLGAAAGGGFPQWNCNSALCRRVRDGDPAAKPRSQSSIAVSADGERWAVFNASPDLRQQFNDSPALHPREGLRHTPLGAVVLTNADVDHVAGLLTLRERQAFALYASTRVHDALGANPIFNVLHPDYVVRRALKLDEATALRDGAGDDLGLTVTPFAVPGKVALYLEDQAAGPDFGTQEGDTIGLKIEAAEESTGFYYIPGCAAVDGPLAERLQGASLVLFDGTLYRDDEMVEAGLGSKTGKRMGHISISGPEGSLAAFDGLGVRRRIYIHINNSNPVLLEDSEERRTVEAAGWEVAYDGQEIEL